MYKVLDKDKNFVLVKMDIDTFKTIKSDIDEKIEDYEFVFDNPVKASSLVNS